MRAKQNGVVELTSLQFDKRAQFVVNQVPEEKQNDWADYLRGAALILGQKYSLKIGFCGVIEGTLPIGGLSSSAAVTIAFLEALCDVNGITLSEQEIILTAKAAEAFRRGDIDEYGRLSFESGYSTIYNYETGSPELKELYEIMTRTDGIYGGRFSGAGFKGCCVALIDPKYRESIQEKVAKEYLKAFPALEGNFSVHVCNSADGVTI